MFVASKKTLILCSVNVYLPYTENKKSKIWEYCIKKDIEVCGKR